MRRHLFVLPAVAAALVAGGIGRAAVAGADSDVLLHATTTTPATTVAVFGIQPNGACTYASATRCNVTILETDFYSGDLVGQAQDSAAASLTLDYSAGRAMVIASYTGTVKGCPGPGTALFEAVATIGANENSGTIRVIPGSGTEGLSRLTGYGTFDVQTGTGGPATIGHDQLHFSCDSGDHD